MSLLPTEERFFLASARYDELLEQRDLTQAQWAELDA